MERIPILRMGQFLLVTIQVDMHDRLAMTLQDDLTTRIADTGARAYFIGTPDGVADMPLVRSLMGLVESMQARDPGISFGEAMRILEEAREHGLGGVSTSVTQREGEVSVITAHKAKGMEFQRVFVVGLTAREWEKGGKQPLIPSPLTAARERAELVRLLYVAITRAKDQLVLSYAEATAEGRETPPSELIPPGLPQIAPESDPLPLLHADADAPELVRTLTRDYLEKDGLSPSALNEYLESPACFFAKRVLRLSEPQTPATVIGTAVHAGIAAYLNAPGDADAKLAQARAASGRALNASLLPRTSAFDAVSRDVYARIDAFAESDAASRKTVAIEKSYATQRAVEGAEIALRGTIDAVFEGAGGECLVDFKTSSTASKADKEKWQRQIAFYDFLLRANGHAPARAVIAQVGADGVEEHALDIDAAARAAFLDTLDAVLGELLSGKWRAAPPDEDYDAVLELFR